MPTNNPSSEQALALKASDVIIDALTEIGAIAAGEPAAPENLALGLRKLQRLIDTWNAIRRRVYALTFMQTSAQTPNSPYLTLVPNLQPHTIGPTNATFTCAQRPVRIESANIILNTSQPPVRAPLAVHNSSGSGADWWANIRVPTVPTTIPTDLYYQEDWPNGSMWLWPVPIVAYGLELVTWTIITQVLGLNDPFSLPPAYWDAVVYSLAVSLWPSFWHEQQLNPTLIALARDAVKIIETNNAGSPRISSEDSGVPHAPVKRGDFNYYTGEIR